MILTVLNIFSLVPIYFYAVKGWYQKKFNLFSPWFFPLGYYEIYYLFPYLGHAVFLGKTIRGLGNYLHQLASRSFLKFHTIPV
jgi:hypothetical protein